VEKGHLGNQTPTVREAIGNLKKEKRLAVQKREDEQPRNSTSTSKDYFLQLFKVNFAGFSFSL
jgi:hypothetical protein